MKELIFFTGDLSVNFTGGIGVEIIVYSRIHLSQKS
jgi:hypothetical protein